VIMQLGKLLFAGKSVVNGREKISYRQNKLVALPKFVSRKSPFARSKAPADTAALPARKETEPASVAAPRKQPPISAAPKSLAAWTSKLNPISLWAGAAPAPQKQLPAVQADLSLDAVKVVHNDLTDADVEVVPIKSRPAAASAPSLLPAKKSWELLGERLLKATAL
jgi:hypothetical protein